MNDELLNIGGDGYQTWIRLNDIIVIETLPPDAKGWIKGVVARVIMRYGDKIGIGLFANQWAVLKERLKLIETPPPTLPLEPHPSNTVE